MVVFNNGMGGAPPGAPRPPPCQDLLEVLPPGGTPRLRLRGEVPGLCSPASQSSHQALRAGTTPRKSASLPEKDGDAGGPRISMMPVPSPTASSSVNWSATSRRPRRQERVKWGRASATEPAWHPLHRLPTRPRSPSALDKFRSGYSHKTERRQYLPHAGEGRCVRVDYDHMTEASGPGIQ